MMVINQLVRGKEIIKRRKVIITNNVIGNI